MDMASIDFNKARFNMIEQQVRPWNVLDLNILDILDSVPREDFVPDAYRNMAYSDMAIPIGHGEEMLHPKYQAHILQALALKPTDTALEIGSGTGYLTALMAKMAAHVYSIDIEPDFIKTASANLGKHNVTNVTLEEGDALSGWSDHAPYDAIAVTGSVAEISQDLKNNLKIGGRLFAIVGDSPTMNATLIVRSGENSWDEQILFETDVKALHGGAKPPTFEF